MGVTLSPLDLAFLEALAGELAYLRGAKSLPTSEAVRHLVAEEKRRPGRIQTLPVNGQDRDFAFFIKDKMADGEEVLLRLDLETGAVELVGRRKYHGGALVHDRVLSKRKR